MKYESIDISKDVLQTPFEDCNCLSNCQTVQCLPQKAVNIRRPLYDILHCKAKIEHRRRDSRVPYPTHHDNMHLVRGLTVSLHVIHRLFGSTQYQFTAAYVKYSYLCVASAIDSYYYIVYPLPYKIFVW